jgi:hypothetical protein|tara:strand:+ start:5041 stop:5229 length:189 start_codon:yes stop_codon:yes gene_type:complete
MDTKAERQFRPMMYLDYNFRQLPEGSLEQDKELTLESLGFEVGDMLRVEQTDDGAIVYRLMK